MEASYVFAGVMADQYGRRLYVYLKPRLHIMIAVIAISNGALKPWRPTIHLSKLGLAESKKQEFCDNVHRKVFFYKKQQSLQAA